LVCTHDLGERDIQGFAERCITYTLACPNEHSLLCDSSKSKEELVIPKMRRILGQIPATGTQHLMTLQCITYCRSTASPCDLMCCDSCSHSIVQFGVVYKLMSHCTCASRSCNLITSYHIHPSIYLSIYQSIYLLSVTTPLYDRCPSSGDVEDEYVDEDDKGGDDDDDDEVQIVPSRGKKGSSSTNSRSTPRSVEKKKSALSRTLNAAVTTSSSGGRGRGREAVPQRDDIEDDEDWDRSVKTEVRQVRTEKTIWISRNSALCQLKSREPSICRLSNRR
jgi:hypothetical protein